MTATYVVFRVVLLACALRRTRMDVGVDLKQKQQIVTDEGTLGTETVKRRACEPTSKLAADSTLSPKV